MKRRIEPNVRLRRRYMFFVGLSCVTMAMIMTNVCTGSGLLMFPAFYNYAGGSIYALVIQMVGICLCISVVALSQH